MTVTLHSGQPGNVLELDDRNKMEVKSLSTGSTSVLISTADSGKFLVVPAFTSAATITLPAVEDGLNFQLYIAGALASGTYSFAAPTTGTMVVYNDAAADSINVGKATGAGTIGAAVRFVSNGTKWYSIMQPAFTSAAPTTLTMNEYGIVS